jgi:hypothetical protein
VSIVQDLPISKPFVPSEIDRVAAAKAVTAYAPLYLDLLSGGPRLQGVIERIKSLGQVLRLATCNVRLGVQGGGKACTAPYRSLRNQPRHRRAWLSLLPTVHQAWLLTAMNEPTPTPYSPSSRPHLTCNPAAPPPTHTERRPAHSGVLHQYAVGCAAARPHGGAGE